MCECVFAFLLLVSDTTNRSFGEIDERETRDRDDDYDNNARERIAMAVRPLFVICEQASYYALWLVEDVAFRISTLT